MNSNANNSKSLGSTIIGRLEDFNESLRRGDDVCAKYTTRKVQLNLEPMPYKAETVKETRQLMRMSQPVFARFLGVSVKTLQSWEQGKQPAPKMACRLMDEIRLEPEHWFKRFQEMLRSTDSDAVCK